MITKDFIKFVPSLAQQLSFDFEKYDRIEDGLSKVDVYVNYNVYLPAKNASCLHIMKANTIDVKIGDVINIYCTPRKILKSGGEVTKVYNTFPTDILLGDFQQWNYWNDGYNSNYGRIGQGTLSLLTETLNITPTDLVTCILYRSLA